MKVGWWDASLSLRDLSEAISPTSTFDTVDTNANENENVHDDSSNSVSDDSW